MIIQLRQKLESFEFSFRRLKMSNQQKGLNIPARTEDVRIPSGIVILDGELSVPQNASSIVLFVHGSGSGRHSPRNQYVANIIREAGIGTLLFDLLTQEEEI